MNKLLTEIRRNVEQARMDAGWPAREPDNPETLTEARRQTEAFRRGIVYFYNDQEVAIGLRNIDWSGSHIRHQEWPAQLNRFFWLRHLAKVYRADRDPSVARLARASIEDWIDGRGNYAADRPLGVGDTTLNLSIRIGKLGGYGWWTAALDFEGSDAFDETFTERMLASTRGQIDALRSRLTATGNWRISELSCLLFCGLILPGFEDHAVEAARGLREALYRQVEPDGAHTEHTPSYHGGMTRIAQTLWHLSQARPELPLPNDAARVARMLDYATAAETPDGGSAGIHDSAAWQPGPGPARLQDNRRDFIRKAGLAPEQTAHPEPAQWFPDAGQLFARNKSEPAAEWLFFDASRWGGGHCHLSRLAVSLYARGRMLLYDPGIFSYEMSDPYAAYGKSTPAHNTVTVANGNQCQADPQDARAHVLKHFVFAQASYEAGYWPGRYTWSFQDGYGAGQAGRHTRWLLWIKGRYLLVLDRIRGDRNDAPYAAHWQLPSGPCHLDTNRQQLWTTHQNSNVLVRLLYASAPMTVRVREGETDPIAGWLPDNKHGGRRPAPQLAFEGTVARAPCDFLTLIMPFGSGDPPDIDAQILSDGAVDAARGRKPIGMEPRTPVELSLRHTDGVEDIVLFRPGLQVMADDGAHARTDGTLAFIQKRNGHPEKAFMLDGYRLATPDQTLIDSPTGGLAEWGP